MTSYEMAARLPEIPVLRTRCRALAVLERIADSGYPFYAYTQWGSGTAGLMSNGSGDEWAVVFTGEGAFIRVFDHESEMSPYPDLEELWPGLLDGLPAEFRDQLDEPAFADDLGRFLATAVLWRRPADDRWYAGADIDFPPLRGPYDTHGPDGARMLEILCDDVVDRYVGFAEDYHERDIDRAAVEHVVAHRPLTEDVVRALNPECTLADVAADVAATDYPIAAT